VQTKLSFSGRAVVNTYERTDQLTKKIKDLCVDEQGIVKFIHGKNDRNEIIQTLIKAPGHFVLLFLCINYRNQVDPLVLIMILQRTQWIIHMTQESFNSFTEMDKRMKKVQKLMNL